MKSPLMILFAKAPVAGKVKTRLMPVLSAEQAADLHQTLVREAWQLATSFRPAATVELHTDVPTAAWGDMHPRRLQTAGDLGARMLAALTSGLGAGHLPCLILGSDAPRLPRGHLVRLLESAADVTLGPTEDGGYYAISCRRVTPALFAGVRWSTADALADTARAARSSGLSVETGPSWFDVDIPEDLKRLEAAGMRFEYTGEAS